jgi:hypothetical protein
LAGHEDHLVGVAGADEHLGHGVPTLPVAPTIATPADTAGEEQLATWSWTIAAVNALPLVTATSVRWRSDTATA